VHQESLEMPNPSVASNTRACSRLATSSFNVMVTLLSLTRGSSRPRCWSISSETGMPAQLLEGSTGNSSQFNSLDSISWCSGPVAEATPEFGRVF
jgi:hypothetical protein